MRSSWQQFLNLSVTCRLLTPSSKISARGRDVQVHHSAVSHGTTKQPRSKAARFRVRCATCHTPIACIAFELSALHSLARHASFHFDIDSARIAYDNARVHPGGRGTYIEREPSRQAPDSQPSTHALSHGVRRRAAYQPAQQTSHGSRSDWDLGLHYSTSTS